MKTLVISAICIVISCSISGQVGFFDGTEQVLGEEDVFSTVCVGFEDLNGDLKDDLFLLDQGIRLKTFHQQAPGQSFEYTDHLQVSTNGDWSFISGDLDNDGIPEIISSGVAEGCQFLKFDGEKYNTSYNLASGALYAQNSNLVDLNNDGFLDFFICNDDGASIIFLNDGNGGMIQSDLIDFQTSPSDDMSGNYTSIFMDIDGDDDQDLYIGKCKSGVDDPADPRRVNTLYINNGDGTFTERAEEFGLNTGAQSWSVDAGDVDNDGDLDIIIANHHAAHDLMINDGNGHFDRMALTPGGYENPANQSFFCDFDNNGWLDIFITDLETTFILFNDEMSFTRRDLVNSDLKAFSGATGDLNADGFPDLYLSFADGFQLHSDRADKVWLNETNTNNYLDINLIGTVSNRDAVGAKIVLYQNEKIQTRELIVGKSYGIMNTTTVHFGLGKTTKVDSIRVKWPSGIETLMKDISKINTLISITEDGCIAMTYDMPDLQLCRGDSVEISLPLEYDNYTWSHGDTGSRIWIKETGWYNVEFEIDGCLTRSSYFQVTDEIELEQDQILSQQEIVACEGDVVELDAYPGIAYFWSTGETTQVIEVMESGIYNVTMSTSCDNYISGDVNVFFAETNIPEVENDSVLIGQVATFVGDGEVLNWYQHKNDLEPLATGTEFETPEIFEDQTYYVGEVTEGFGFNQSLMKSVPLNNVADSIYSQNDFVEFEALEEMILYSVKVRTQTAGVRKIVILKENEELTSFDVNLAVGVNTINIDYQFEPGTYRIGTDAGTNQTNLGTNHPALSYSDLYIKEDKQIRGFLNISDSDIYPGISPYFFDWEIYYGYYYCEPRVPVHAFIKMPVSTSETFTNLYVYPNPTSGQLSVRTDLNIPFSIDVFDISGARVIETIEGSQSITTFEMPKASGLYFLKLTSGTASEIMKVYVY